MSDALTQPSPPPFTRNRSAQDFRRATFGVLGAGLLALAVMAAVAFWLVGRAREDGRWVDHTYVVQSDINQYEALSERAETARRGYLLVPGPGYQHTYELAKSQIVPILDQIAVDTMDNPIQRQNVARLRALTKEQFARVGEMMALVQARRFDEALAAFKRDHAQQSMTHIRTLAQALQVEEARLLKLRTARESDDAGVLLGVVLVGAALLALLSLGSLLLMRRYAADLDRAQADLRVLNTDLEARVTARTFELSRANEEIQRFAYIVSHDLRSPLVNVMGFTSELELALKPLRGLVDWIKANAPERLPKVVVEAVEVEMPEAIGFIRSSTKKMDGLINAILRLSREGRRNLTPEPLAMTAVVESLIDSVRHRLTERDAQASIDGALPDLICDRLAVEQVFGNLIDNAVKYFSPKRAGAIVIRGRRDAGRLIYEVQDNGRGIDPKDHERIFELFRRSGMQDQAGEGIGLAHVRALMYRLGGTITCISNLDQGATFRLSFPPELHSDRS